MAIDDILISALPCDRRAAAFAGGELVRLVLTGPGEPPRPGDIFLGRVTKRMPAMGGAFVELGSGRPGLLMEADATGGRAPSEGAAVRVEVIRAAEDGKGPKLSQRFSDPQIATLAATQPPPCRLRAAPDPIAALLRAAASPALRRVIVDDPASLAQLRTAVPAIADRLQAWLGPAPLFAAHDVDAAIGALLSPDVRLPGGGRVRIEETAALTAIDVDTAAANGSSARTTAFACDLAAAAVIGDQVRRRELAGRIVIDFVPVRRPAERERVLAALQAGFAGDDRLVRIAGWTRLGLVELLRERRGPSLARRLGGPCPTCAVGTLPRAAWLVAGDALRAALATARESGTAGTDRPLVLRAPADVLSTLRGPLAEALRCASDRLGRPLTLYEDASALAAGYVLET